MLRSFLLILGLVINWSCYSFKGITIPQDARTFSVLEFDNFSTNVLPTLSQTFTESLKRRILSQTRLSYQEVNGDLEFSGAISEYRISPVAPQAGGTSQFNRLTISVQVNYDNLFDEKKNWSSNFSRFADYESNANFTSLQDNLIDEINDQIIEDIFNKAFTDW